MIKVLRYAGAAKKLGSNPVSFIADTIIVFVVNLIVPIPLAGQVALKYKGPILGFLASIAILFIFILIAAGTVLLSPALVTSRLVQVITGPFTPSTSSIPADTSFADTQIPKQNPFGGSGMSYTAITAYFLDPNYFLEFGKQHEGVDLVPTDTYYQQSTTYQSVHQVVLFSTLTGTVNHYIDQYGGEPVEVTNNDGSLKSVNIHFSSVLVNTGDYIKAGTAIGIMGQTGDATGPHLHYQIDIKDGSNWDPVTPLNYIQ